MDSINGSSSSIGAYLATQGVARFIPEPKSRASAAFGGILKGLGSVASQGISSVIGIDPAYAELLNQQIQVQQQLQVVSMESNVEKSRHETQMAAIRNIRVG